MTSEGSRIEAEGTTDTLLAKYGVKNAEKMTDEMKNMLVMLIVDNQERSKKDRERNAKNDLKIFLAGYKAGRKYEQKRINAHGQA